MRARFVDQGEPARPPGEGRRHDPMPPPSPGETSAGPSTPSESTGSGEKCETEAGRAEERHQEGKRPQRPSRDARKRAGERTEEGGAPGGGEETRAGGLMQVGCECTCVCVVVCSLAPSRGGVLQLRGNPVRGANPRRPVFTLRPFPCERAPPRARAL